jgi:hypothetical protein
LFEILRYLYHFSPAVPFPEIKMAVNVLGIINFINFESERDEIDFLIFHLSGPIYWGLFFSSSWMYSEITKIIAANDRPPIIKIMDVNVSNVIYCKLIQNMIQV